jgi:hypothetical protein
MKNLPAKSPCNVAQIDVTAFYRQSKSSFKLEINWIKRKSPEDQAIFGAFQKFQIGTGA